jgi:lipopolysaccharide/colanic/teichoic acid biosynthesis glycosyltransferase
MYPLDAFTCHPHRTIKMKYWIKKLIRFSVLLAWTMVLSPVLIVIWAFVEDDEFLEILEALKIL